MLSCKQKILLLLPLLLLLLLVLLLLLGLSKRKKKKDKINIPLVTFAASPNVLLDCSNSFISSVLDEDSKRVFTCHQNEMFLLDKTDHGMKKNFCLHDLTGYNDSNFIHW